MPRRRIGLVVLVPDPVRSEIDVLRRALGSPTVDRIPPHITVVSPINLRDDDVRAVLHAMFERSSTIGAFDVACTGVGTFAPVSPVLKVDVDHESAARIAAVRADVRCPPLERDEVHPYVPHITLHDDMADGDIADAIRVLRHYTTTFAASALSMLEFDGSRWNLVADVLFGEGVRVGTGGLVIDLTASTVVHPLVQESLGLSIAASDLAVTAIRDGEVVGVAAAAKATNGAVDVVALRVASAHRGQGVGRHLLNRVRYLVDRQAWGMLRDRTNCPDAGLVLQQSGIFW